MFQLPDKQSAMKEYMALSLDSNDTHTRILLTPSKKSLVGISENHDQV